MMMRCVSREKGGPRTPRSNNTVIYPVEIVQTMKINGFTEGESMEKEKKIEFCIESQEIPIFWKWNVKQESIKSIGEE